MCAHVSSIDRNQMNFNFLLLAIKTNVSLSMLFLFLLLPRIELMISKTIQFYVEASRSLTRSMALPVQSMLRITFCSSPWKRSNISVILRRRKSTMNNCWSFIEDKEWRYIGVTTFYVPRRVNTNS